MTKKKDKPHIMYTTDGKGNWWRVEWAKQCSEEIILYGRCQGVEGHKGDHWCYSPGGDYNHSHNYAEGKLESHEIAGGSCPPGHKSYTNPEKMQKYFYMSSHQKTKVTDKKVIARLENDDPPEKHASLNRPVPEEKVVELGLRDKVNKKGRKKK